MANIHDALVALSGLGFETAGNFSFGTWDQYALLLRPAGGKNLFATFAVRLPKNWKNERKALVRALKEKGLKGVRMAGITKSTLSFSLGFGKADGLAAFFTDALNALSAAMKESGIAPADSCFLSGAPRPDSLCVLTAEGVPCFQPVCAAAVRDKDAKTHEKIEDNRENGSYMLGFGGALLGMLLGVIVNVLGIVFTERIYALLFALVPLAAMFGYKLCKGKMSRGSIGIVILLSLLGVFLIPMFELTFYFVRDYGAPLMDSLLAAASAMTDPKILSELRGELLQLLLFMALGIWIAWRFMSNQTNSSQAVSSETQMSTLRPNPRWAHAPERDV